MPRARPPKPVRPISQRSVRRRGPTSLRLGRDERGSVSVEYAVLLCVVAIGCAFAVAALGEPLVAAYEGRVTLLLLPFP